jgi:hypothetical protein
VEGGCSPAPEFGRLRPIVGGRAPAGDDQEQLPNPGPGAHALGHDHSRSSTIVTTWTSAAVVAPDGEASSVR